MKSILFVDDEPQILDAMRNMLRKKRKEWDMVFLDSSRDALRALSEKPFDIIVSDMRMPGMDGAELLAEVCRLYPRTSRFVLSGQAEKETIFRVLPYAQQFMSKPCDPEELTQVLSRTLSLQDRLADPFALDSVGGIQMLPINEKTHERLSQVLRQSNASIHDVAAIVERDPAMVAKVLQLVNSAFFGHSKKTVSARRALSLMGLDLFRSLIEDTEAFSCCPSHRDYQSIADNVQVHSIETAELAVEFVDDPSLLELTYTAGLLHDIGKLALASSDAESCFESNELAFQTMQTVDHVEHQLNMVNHSTVGGYLLALWGLPTEIVECAAYHHRPQAVEGEAMKVLMAVHAADAMLDASKYPGFDAGRFLSHGAIEAAGYGAQIERWKKIFERKMSENGSRAFVPAPHPTLNRK